MRKRYDLKIQPFFRIILCCDVIWIAISNVVVNILLRQNKSKVLKCKKVFSIKKSLK